MYSESHADQPPSRDGIAPDTVVVASGDQVSTELEGEVIILSLESGRCYCVDNVGARIWKLLNQPRRVREIRDAILEEYDVDGDLCERDLIQHLEGLADRGLIEIRAQSPP